MGRMGNWEIARDQVVVDLVDLVLVWVREEIMPAQASIIRLMAVLYPSLIWRISRSDARLALGKFAVEYMRARNGIE